LLLCGALLAPAISSAQSSGIRAGRFRIHPEAVVEGRYDNNIYREDTAEEGPTSVAYFRLMPGLRFENPRPGKLGIDGAIGMEIRQYLESLISEQQGRFGMAGAARAVLGPNQPVRFFVQQDLRRQLEVGSGFSESDEKIVDALTSRRIERETVDVGCAGDYDGDGEVDGGGGCTYTFWRNHTRAGLLFAPGGGRLTVEPSYAFTWVDFIDVDTNDSTTHNLALAGRWGFFPKTSAVVDVGLGFQSYKDLPGTQRPTVVHDTMPLRATAGIRGLLTYKLSVDIGAGYGSTLADGGEDFSGVIGRAELRYAFTDNVVVRGGYRREFAASALANFNQSHALLGDVKIRLGGQVNFIADVGVWFREFPAIEAHSDAGIEFPTDRSDTFLVGRARAEWFPNDWFNLKVGWRMDSLGSDWKFVDPVTKKSSGSVEYQRQQVFASMGVAY